MLLFFVDFIWIWANHFFLESTGPSAQASNIGHGMESGEGCTVPARGRSQCSCKLARNGGAATASQHISFQCQHCSCWACSRMASSDSLLENDGVEPGEERCSDLQHVHHNLYQSLRTAEILGPLWGYESIWGVQGQIHLQCHHQGMWKDGTVATGHLLTAGHAAAECHTGWSHLQRLHCKREGEVGHWVLNWLLILFAADTNSATPLPEANRVSGHLVTFCIGQVGPSTFAILEVVFLSHGIFSLRILPWNFSRPWDRENWDMIQSAIIPWSAPVNVGPSGKELWSCFRKGW